LKKEALPAFSFSLLHRDNQPQHLLNRLFGGNMVIAHTTAKMKTIAFILLFISNLHLLPVLL
jgi:hypothetical protein